MPQSKNLFCPSLAPSLLPPSPLAPSFTAQSSADQVSAHNDECVIIDTDETVVRKPVLCLKTPPPPPPPPPAAAGAQSSADQLCPLKMVTKLMTTVRPRPTFVLKKCEISESEQFCPCLLKIAIYRVIWSAAAERTEQSYDLIHKLTNKCLLLKMATLVTMTTKVDSVSGFFLSKSGDTELGHNSSVSRFLCSGSKQ